MALTRWYMSAALSAVLFFALAVTFFLAAERAHAQQVIQKIEALVNDQVISAHDVSQRMGLVIMASGQTISNEEQLIQLREQVLESLVNETLQVQEANQYEVPVPEEEILQAYARVASNYNRSVDNFGELLESFGTSSEAILRQIRAEFAWQSLVNGRYGSYVAVTDADIDEVIANMEKNAGQMEYRISEIFININHPTQEARVAAMATQIKNQIPSYMQFPQVARQFSQSTTAAQGGDLGWVTQTQIPPEVYAAVKDMDVLAVSEPIKTVGGFYIIALTDRRKIMGVDDLDELLDLSQVGWFFEQTTTEEEARAWYEMAAQKSAEFDSCSRFNGFVASLGEKAVARELGEIPVKQLNPELRRILDPIGPGQASEPINTPDGFIIFVICNRRMPETVMPDPAEIQSQIEQQRIAMMARRYLRDLRRDAIIDYK